MMPHKMENMQVSRPSHLSIEVRSFSHDTQSCLSVRHMRIILTGNFVWSGVSSAFFQYIC